MAEVPVPQVVRGEVRKTEVSKGFAERHWRPSQSVVDIIQNHLDAQEQRWEVSFLQRLNITKPKDKPTWDEATIHKVILLGHQIRRFKGTKVADDAYAQLHTFLRDEMSIQVPKDSQEFKAKLEKGLAEIPEVPKLQLKVRKLKEDGTPEVFDDPHTQGEEGKIRYRTRFVDYDQMTQDEWKDWEVVGFKTFDTGTGFDRELLTKIGLPLKTANPFRRGGFGEGLKVSTLRLTTLGAKVRLLSRHDRELWHARPQVGTDNTGQDTKLAFSEDYVQGKEPNGSWSESVVDFSGCETKDLHTFQHILDPRKGEGLGEYILSYADNTSGSNTSAGGRVYVLDLLIREQEPTLFSYNLLDKRAVVGRDRNEIDASLLERAVQATVRNLTDYESVKILMDSIKWGGGLMETKVFQQGITLQEQQRPVWKQAIQDAFDFDPKTSVFQIGPITAELKQLAKEYGKKIIHLPLGNFSALISMTQDLFREEIPEGQSIELSRLAERTQPPKGKELDGGIREGIQNTVRDFTYWIAGQAEINSAITIAGMDRLGAMHVGTLQETNSPYEAQRARSPVVYKGGDNTLHVYPDGPIALDFATRIGIIGESLKVFNPDWRFQQKLENSFSPETQEVLNQAIKATMRKRGITEENFPLPQLENISLSDLVESHLTYYSADQKQQDARVIETGKVIEDILLVDLQKQDVEQRLAQLRQTSQQTSLLESQITEAFGMYYFVFGGKVYHIDPHNLELKEVTEMKDADKANQDGESTFRINIYDNNRGPRQEKKSPVVLFSKENTYTAKQGDHSFIPFHLDDGQLAQITISGEDGLENIIQVQRKGEELVYSDPLASYMMGSRGSISRIQRRIMPQKDEFGVFGNTLYIHPEMQGYTLHIEKGPFNNPQKPETRDETIREIKTDIAIEYGKGVWDSPIRSFLDAIQNHIDAQQGRMPEITCTVVNKHTYQVEEVSRLQLGDEKYKNQDEWAIVGIGIQDTGDGYTTNYLTSLGDSTKADGDRGKYGEGLKMLILGALRNNLQIELRSRNWIARPGKYVQPVLVPDEGEYRDFEFLKFDLAWLPKGNQSSGSQSHFSALTLLQPGQKELSSPEQISEFHRLIDLRAAGRGKLWFDWADVIDERSIDASTGKQGLNRYILAGGENVASQKGLALLLADRKEQVFEKDLIVTLPYTSPIEFELPEERRGLQLVEAVIKGKRTPVSIAFPTYSLKESSFKSGLTSFYREERMYTGRAFNSHNQRPLFGYNVDGQIITSRERNMYDSDRFRSYIVHYFANLQDTSIMKTVLLAAKEEATRQSGIQYLEFSAIGQAFSSMNSATKALWRQVYFDTFGDDTILSLAPLAADQHRRNYGDPFGKQSQERDSYKGDLSSRQIVEGISIEDHLRTENLIQLPEELTDFFAHFVYSSHDAYVRVSTMPDVQLAPEQHEQIYQAMKGVGEQLIMIIREMQQDPEKAKVLYDLVPQAKLEEKIEQFNQFTSANVHIKNEEFPAAALFHSETGPLEVDLNKVLFADKEGNTVGTFAHELLHFFSGGANDHTVEFNRWLLIAALEGKDIRQVN